MGTHQLLSVADYESLKRRERDRAEWTGVACPACGRELRWEGPLLTSLPPKREAVCENGDCVNKGCYLTV